MKNTATDRESDLARSRRKREVRAKTLHADARRLSTREKEEIFFGALNYPTEEHEFGEGRPRTRAECANVPRPCPFVSCAHHLYLDVNPRSGALKLRFPDIEPQDMPAERSCALDVRDQGGVTLEVVGEAMNITRERVRQIEVDGLAKLRASGALNDWRESGTQTKRRLPILEARDDLEYEEDEAEEEWIPEASGAFLIAEDEDA